MWLIDALRAMVFQARAEAYEARLLVTRRYKLDPTAPGGAVLVDWKEEVK